MRMGVIEADDVEALKARLSPRVDVIFRIDEESMRIGCEVARPDGLDDSIAGANEDATAFGGRRRTRMRHDRVLRPSADGHRHYGTSTTIAIPMPPPMHNAATPRRSFRARSAYSRVVSTRAPLAPIGWPSAIAPP